MNIKLSTRKYLVVGIQKFLLDLIEQDTWVYDTETLQMWFLYDGEVIILDGVTLDVVYIQELLSSDDSLRPSIELTNEN